MIQLSWAILLIFYYCYSAESAVIVKEPGENITLNCSSEECITEKKCTGMYLYHNYTEHNEVYYYSNHFNSKMILRSRYKGRIESNGAPMNHSFIMTNLSVDDSGVYACVYKESVDKSVECKVYTVFVRGVRVVEKRSCENTSMIHPTNMAPCPGQDDQHILVFIISIGVLGMLLIVVFILLIIQKVKQRCSGKKRPRRSMQESSDVYEVMTKSDLCPVSEHSSESPYELD